MSIPIMANRFTSYEQARDVYNSLCDKYGATRIDWGFGRWLWLGYNAAERGEIEYWRDLNAIGILTADGRRRLAKAEKQERRREVTELIQWPTAKYWTAQWNPVIGCKPCSSACEHCYAAAWAKRFGQSFEPHKSSKVRPPRKGVVFCGNMTDLFGEWEFRCDIAYQIGQCVNRGATAYLWLTKRVDIMCDVLNREKVLLFVGGDEDGAELFSMDDPECNLSNHYFGFTAENQGWYDRRIKAFRRGMPTWVNGWLSAEPLLGPIDLGLRYIAPEDAPFEWVVVGCESGPNRRPCKIEWVESIVEQCRAANVPVFVKQLDIGWKCVTDINKFPPHLQIRQVPWAQEGGAK